MSTERDKSAIEEVRDQMSLDYADGEYLSHISSNLGIVRPPFGFSDDSWRAIVRVLALQFKQVKSKFEDLLFALFGPKISVGGTLSEAASAGDDVVYLNDSSAFPQLGTIILDENLGTEEAVEYSFIDRTTNKVYLSSTLTFDHDTHNQDDEQPIIFDASVGDTLLYVPTADFLPTTLPTTVIIGRGTASEETVAIIVVDTDSRTVTVSPALTNDHVGLTPSPIQDELFGEYKALSEFLTLADSSKLPSEGYVLLGASSNSFTATGGSTTSVTVAAGGLTEDRHVGSVFVFDGNITAALAGVEAKVITNTSNTATFYEALPAAVAAGDTFSIRTVAEFINNSYDDNVLVLRRDIVDAEYSSGTEVELLVEGSTLCVAQAKVAGAGWDVIQSTPRLVELLIPPAIQDVNDILSASYLHPEIQAPTATTLAAGTSIGDTSVAVTDVSDWPYTGQLIIDAGNANEEYIGYKRTVLSRRYVAAGSTPTVIEFSPALPAVATWVGQTVYIQDLSQDISVSRVISATPSATSVEFEDPLPNELLDLFRDFFTLLTFYHPEEVETAHDSGFEVAHLATETVEYQETALTGSLTSGDLWSDDHSWPGPYLYDIGEQAPTSAGLSTKITNPVPGVTRLSVGQLINSTAIEVDNATSFNLSSFPYTVRVGRESGTRENVIVRGVALASRCITDVAANSLVGDTSIQVSSLSPTAANAGTFPDESSYRVLVDREGPNEEVLIVTGTQTGPDRLTVLPTTIAHSIGETVELIKDVLAVDPLDNTHLGAIPFSDRTLFRNVVGVNSTLTAAASEEDLSISVSDTSKFSDFGMIRIKNKEYSYAKSGSTDLIIRTPGGLKEDYIAGTEVYMLRKQSLGELVEPLIEEIPVISTTGFPSEGTIILNFGSGLLPVSSALSVAAVTGDTILSLDSTADFPVTYPYEIVIGPGTEKEERALVTANNTGLNQLTLAATVVGVKFGHPLDTKVQVDFPTQQVVEYDSKTANTFGFSTPVVLDSTHYPSEVVLRSDQRSVPGTDGFDFPLRMPTDILFRLQFLIDLIRAAGVQVAIIDSR